VDACEYGGRRVREDAILAMIRHRFAHLFKQRDRIIGRAMEIATEAVKDNRAEADRINRQLADVEREQSRLVELLMDRAIPDAAKTSLGRKLADVERQRELLLAAIDGLREQATADTAGLAKAIRHAFDEARESLASVATPEQFNRFVDEFVGPMEVQADGAVTQKKTPSADSEGVLQSNVAGGGFEPPTSGL
jgi:replicative superfamily II helicase